MQGRPNPGPCPLESPTHTVRGIAVHGEELGFEKKVGAVLVECIRNSMVKVGGDVLTPPPFVPPEGADGA